ncbi:MAG: NRDE family protein [Azoarcus sp.]|jgi:uncharacterized protein with NRDE domain|nr:NRDE family protein [Azoarcus sp.]
MCLILFAWQHDKVFPLVLAANRDEFYRRPALPLARWRDDPAILGGRDLHAGGGWLACHADGRFAAVTNTRRASLPRLGAKSRGWMIADYLRGRLGPAEYGAQLVGSEYGGFNLLLGDRRALYFLSNCDEAGLRRLAPGIYGLSNDTLETPWPKVVRGKAAFAAALTTLPAPESFFDLLADHTPAADDDLPSSGVPLEWERALSPIFIATPDYGTRASTLLLGRREGGFRMLERSFRPGGSWLEDAVEETG